MHDCDILVVGCGPGGSTAATFLSRAGCRVMVLERERFPRFHVGESLLPYNRALFEEMGVWSAVSAAGFPVKKGARFMIANGSKQRRFVFREGPFTRESEIIQVERAPFDHLLMSHARECGAEVREGWRADRFSVEDDGVSVKATDPEGRVQTLRARFLVDASGRANMTGNQENLRQVYPRHRKCAVFGHFTGVTRERGEPGGDTVIVRAADHWFWLIPVSSEKTSVGLVLDKARLALDHGDGEAAFRRAIASSSVMSERMSQARLLEQLKTTADFSYINRRLSGPRCLRVGDAAGFMDPIFSAGVYLAMWSGRLAAESVARELKIRGDGTRTFRRYERRVKKAMGVYWRLVEQYYTTSFMEVFLEPRPAWNLPAAVVAVLAGELEPPWRIWWRLELFHLLVRLQRHRALVPRLDFEGIGSPEAHINPPSEGSRHLL